MRISSRVVVALPALALIATLVQPAAPLCAQGITGPLKTPKGGPGSAVEILEAARRGLVFEEFLASGGEGGDGVGDVLIAALHERVKQAGPDSFGPEEQLSVKRALARVEEQVRTVVRRVEADEASPDEALIQLQVAVREYLARIEGASRRNWPDENPAPSGR